MARRLPSLNALRAFEAAARHSSFTKAAEELFVTHAAISRQVRELEAWLGVSLFVRLGRGVEPTEIGAEYQQGLTRIFDELLSQTESVRKAKETEALTVRVDPAFTHWLVPRLGRFQAQHPEVELNLDPSYEPLTARSGRIDLAIQWGMNGEWEGVDVRGLVEVNAFPVCSPQFLEGKTLNNPEDLTRYLLLHEESRGWWSEWFEAVGVSGAESLKGPKYEESRLTLLAAEASQGFALADDVVAEQALKSGRLVKVFDLTAPAGAYYLVRGRSVRESPAAKAFRKWLEAEVKSLPYSQRK